MMHGWINFDKHIGITSTQAVNQVKKIFNVKKAGHLGTLDPLASGVLPIALGEATKTIPYISCNLKSYNFTIQWGEQRTTDDAEGEIVSTSSIKPDCDQISHAIKKFTGEVMQIPPTFSAIKINGKRAYKLARNGSIINIKPRLIQVYELKLLSTNNEDNSANFFMVCGSGVYVRSIARDLGIELNCFGYITKLRRTMVSDFKEDKSVTIEQLNNKDNIISIESILRSITKIEISSEEVKKIKKGQEVILNNLYNLQDHDICYTVMGNYPIAICSFICGYIKPIRVFNI